MLLGQTVEATAHIPKNSFVCELKTNRVCLPDDFVAIIRDYKFNYEPVVALLIKVSQDQDMIYDCTSRLVQYGR